MVNSNHLLQAVLYHLNTDASVFIAIVQLCQIIGINENLHHSSFSIFLLSLYQHIIKSNVRIPTCSIQYLCQIFFFFHNEFGFLQVVDIMRVNVDKVLERDQKISELDDRAGMGISPFWVKVC